MIFKSLVDALKALKFTAMQAIILSGAAGAATSFVCLAASLG